MASSIIASHPNLRPHLKHVPHTTPSPVPFPATAAFPATRTAHVTVKCSGETGNPNLKDILSGMVDERVELLLNKEENRALLDGLDEATQRVERAKEQLAEFDKQEAEAKRLRDYVNRLQSTTSEIAECQREISEAKAMLEEANRSLEENGAGLEGGSFSESINKDAERLESIAAASVSAIVGTIAGLPLSLTRATGLNDLIVPLGITFVSCALFGVTYRYAVRRDLDNSHLKTGTSSAFGVVKGLAMAGGAARPNLQLDISSLYPIALDSAVSVAENLLIFLFAGVALDFCMKSGVLSPYPIAKTKSQQ